MDPWRVYQRLQSHYVFEIVASTVLFLILSAVFALPLLAPDVAGADSCPGNCIPADPILASVAVAAVATWFLFVLFAFLRIPAEPRFKFGAVVFVLCFSVLFFLNRKSPFLLEHGLTIEKLSLALLALLALAVLSRPLYYQKRVFALLNRALALTLFAAVFLSLIHWRCILPGERILLSIDTALEKQDAPAIRRLLQKNQQDIPKWAYELISVDRKQKLAAALQKELESEASSFTCQWTQSWSTLTIPNAKNTRDLGAVLQTLRTIQADFASVNEMVPLRKRPELEWPGEILTALESCSIQSETSSFRCRAGLAWLVLRSLIISNTLDNTCSRITPQPTRYRRCAIESESDLYCSFSTLCLRDKGQNKCLGFNWMYSRSDPVTFDFVESSAKLGISEPDLIRDMESAIIRDLRSFEFLHASQGWCMTGALPQSRIAFRIGIPSTGQNALWLTLFNPTQTGPVRRFYKKEYPLVQDPYGCEYFATR